MSIGVGQGPVAREGVATAGASTWPARVLAACGGGVVVVCLLMWVAAWSDGLRPSSFERLRSDIAAGSVVQWYAASSLDTGPLDVARAEQAGMSDGVGSQVSEDADVAAPEGYPDGGILVWRTWGQTGWSVAGPDDAVSPEMSADATGESTALVRQLREAGVAMRPFGHTDSSVLDGVFGLGGVALLGRLVLGPATRVGTKWFWFWLLVGAPLALGAVAYAVTELVGLRRRRGRSPGSRLTGIVGFAGGILLSLAVGVALEVLTSWGVPVPL
ncbi:hypothetical protein [Knoellia aerolata]|uniref:hypothetical protein n=1 Tax=Knoellia aerolata TaxID=442954 RepID=UPI0012ECE2F4|nr:hypothetical protein [Knoellia aerolata]